MKTITLFLLILIGISSLDAQRVNRETDFNFDWKFTLVEDAEIPQQLPLDDSKWRNVRLPHDWSVEFPFSDEWEGCTGYLPGGVGIYQKHFKTPASPKEKSTFVNFDGVYNNATFWLNGKLLGENPYGYSPVNWDLTEHLKTDGSDNVLTVHVDHSRYADSRWYTGSGIYRNVKMVIVDKLHIPIWGTFITTPEVSCEEAKVQLKVKVENQAGSSNFTLATKLIDNAGKVVAQQSDNLKLNGKSNNEFTQNFTVTNPKLWDCENPNMYKAVTTITKENKVVDSYTTPFGIRKIEFITGKGFFLNGKSTFMKGVCLHHDAGLVGSAVPKGVWRRRIEGLKAGGVNAIRTSHNPFSEEFLDLCDEMGILVQNEIFDELDYPKDKRLNLHERHDDYITRGYAEHFQEWGQSDLRRVVLRDRNHPSVVQWSIGNEIEWTYLSYRYVTGFWPDPNDPMKRTGNFWGSRPMFSADEMKERYETMDKDEYVLAETAQRIADWVRELDTTRPTTTNLIIPQVSHVSGYADVVDIAGYSYRNNIFPWSKYYFPEKQTTINECPGTWDDWRQVLEYPGVFSIFMWTGIDYLGESNNRWPARRPWGDMLDLAGFKVQGWNYFKSIWLDEPHLSIGTLPLDGSGFGVDKMSGQAVADGNSSYKWRDSEMHWNYKTGDTLLVEVCSNYSTVELLLNGKSLGYRSMSESPDRLMRWVVPFEAGKLEARAVLGKEKLKTCLVTASEPVKMKFSADKIKLKADAYDVSHLVVQLLDKDGNPVLTENTNVEFEIDGPAKLLGVDCANHHKHQDFQSNKIETYKGRCLAIIQSTKKAGSVTITAKAGGFDSQSVVLETSCQPQQKEDTKTEAPKEQGGFPFILPKEKPNRKMSAAMERIYTDYEAPQPQDNELFSQFKYTELKGFDYNGHDGTISRRDPSKIIFHNGKYYVWYTYRNTPTPPQGAAKCTDEIPSSDWDLSEIWYATSEDGFTWKEQGVAIKRPEKPLVGWRSVTTTDILEWKGKYYLYYQGFMEASGKRGDDCPVTVSWADSPDGPWTPYNKIVIPNGAKGEWDQYSIHDPYPLVHNDKIYIYYKSDFGEKPHLVRMQGLAIGDNPLGPFKKHPLNPVITSGHETSLFPFRSGVAALVYKDGPEHNTIQYAEDWVNFKIASITELMPYAAAPYVPDAFTNTTNGRGITWGLAHFINYNNDWPTFHSVLTRFDCDLSLDLHDPEMKRHRVNYTPQEYYRQGLSKKQMKRITKANKINK